jgi:hypothetical protein
MSQISIRREKQFADRFRKYGILLDGELVDFLRRGEEKEIPVSPGKHIIQLQIDWARSNSIKFTISDNKMLKFVCRSNCSGLRLFAALLYATVWANDYLHLSIESQ